MAHDGAKPSKPDIPIDPDTHHGGVIRPPESGELDDKGSIDKLLALTDDGWDIDEQVRTLQIASGDPPGTALRKAPRTAAPDLVIPSALELAPTQVPKSKAPGAEKPSAKAPSVKPPPLPARASKGPPALPTSAKKGPPPLPSPGRSEQSGSGAKQALDATAPEAISDLLAARLATLEQERDRVGLARAHVELAVVSETVLGDDARAVKHAEAALAVDPSLAAAHAILRRRKHGRSHIAEMLAHLDHEIAASNDEAATVELLVTKARLVDAQSDKGESRPLWERALSIAPNHAGALKGLEYVLTARATQGAPEAWDALAAHLARMADAFGSNAKLGAWLHVERARILELRLGRVDAARAALEKAVELDPSVGPVREAATRHVAAHADMAALATLLEEEAGLERNPVRSARLELDAASIAAVRLGEHARATGLLERAANRAPTTDALDRRVLDDLVRLYAQLGDTANEARARRARIRFFTEPAHHGNELRVLATLAEKLGDTDTAIADTQRALSIDGGDGTLVEQLDRLLSAAGRHEQRVGLWVSEAAKTEDGAKRARALVRAATVADQVLDKRADAIRHFRSALVAHPTDAETIDGLARLLTPQPSERVDGEARALIELYAQGAQGARDAARRVAYLEKIALLWEDLLGDAKRAQKTYEEILSLEPDRRSAILGLQRCAARSTDERALSRALLDEARLAKDGPDVLALKTRAASAIAKVDPARALSIVEDVLKQDADHAAARALETRLHEEAQRWERAAGSLRARIRTLESQANAPKQELVTHWLALAHIQDARLRAPLDALATLQSARAADPKNPLIPDEIAQQLEKLDDPVVLRNALESLAADAPTAAERARYFSRAAEIDELRLKEDGRAVAMYSRALAEAPDDELSLERLSRVLARRALTSLAPDAKATTPSLGELAALQSRRLEQAASTEAARALSFDVASLLAEAGKDGKRSIALLESILAEDPAHVPALRALEHACLRNSDWAGLSRVLAKQGESLRDVRARLGALWALSALEEWKLPASDGSALAKILELDATDPGALEAQLRVTLPLARRGDARARKTTIAALRSLYAMAGDDGARLAMQLRLALLLEASADGEKEGSDRAASREALDRYRAALQADPLSVTAATGLARLAVKLRDAESAYAAATSLADLASAPSVRARYLIDAAELLLDDSTDALGPRNERRARAAALLERALASDPDSIPAAGRLSTVWTDDGHGERLVTVFRTALTRASSPDAIVMLGGEIARVARDELKDLPTAIDAMRRVRAAAPAHVPSLLTLSELCIAQRAWPEAVDALEAVVSTGREPASRLTALFALASIYERVLTKRELAEQALRAALDIEPHNPRALRALLRHIAQTRPVESREEQADLIDSLAATQREPAQKAELLVELATLRIKMGDMPAAERALVEAVANAPGNGAYFTKLAGCFRTAQGRDNVSYARALGQVVARGKALGRTHASWFATLGQIEVDVLGRMRDGIGHYQQALSIEPDMHETRFELAAAFAKAGANDEACRTIYAMIAPDSRPLMAVSDPVAALALLERALGAERRNEEALAVSELRAVAGDLDDGRHAWLRSRRLGPLDPNQPPLDRTTVVTHVLPPEGRHVLLEVAAAIANIDAKMLRADLSEIGISSRDRVSARSGNPTRALFDRMLRMLGLSDVELVITPNVARTRVIAQDEPWVLVPKTLSDLPEPAQMASMGRALARITLGVPWLEELPAPHIEALLIAAARAVAPGYAQQELDVLAQKLVAQYEPGIHKALSRKQKRTLEELAPHMLTPQGRPMPIDAFVATLGRAELRVAYLLTGDLLATIDEYRGIDPALLRATETPGRAALAAVLEHPFAGDVARWAILPEATALKRRLGTAWGG